MESAGSIANKRIFALIGGIASGKTAVSDCLASLGAHIIDADVIARNITAHGSEGERRLIEAFPDCLTDGKPNRALIRQKVFSDEAALKKLNSLTHPLILDEIHRRIEEAEGVIVVVMPVPKELRRYHAVLNVFTPRQIRIDRLVKRDNISVELAEKIIAAQMSDEDAEARSDFTFVNDGDLDKLRQAVTAWWKIYIES